MAQKPEETEDLRIQRTRKLILEALIALTVEKGFAAVTVRDITERAMINRSTFYRHYLDKYDLLEQYMDTVYALTGTEERSPDPNAPEEEHGPLRLFKHVQQHADFYRAMLGTKGDLAFTERFRQNTERRFRSFLQGSNAPNGPPLDLRISCVSHAGIGAIIWWLEHSPQTTPEQLTAWLSELSVSMMGPFVKGR